jgi:LysR family glycine cleavage system transcriptional activator
MSNDLPPMASLVAFEHAAQSLSFKQSAAALHVSASALSRQIQALEELLGVALFRRLNPGLELTPEGVRYLDVARRCLEQLRELHRELGARKGPLRISSLQSFTERWLIPQLPDFERMHPGIELSIEATLRYADFERDPVDVAIRFGSGPFPGLHGEPLVDLAYFPVCNPELRDGGGSSAPLLQPRDLAQHTRIHVSQVPRAWSGWLAAAGVPELPARRELSFDHVAIALRAAETGLGVAVSALLLCADQLAEGKLVRPFALSVPSDQTYHFVCRPESLGDARIVALRNWLVDSLADMPGMPA